MNIISVLEQEQLRDDIPAFRPGDTVKVHVKVVEGNRERVQVFEGVVIGRRAKLHYLRGLTGKAARIRERR